MKRFILIVLLVVITISDFVRSDNDRQIGTSREAKRVPEGDRTAKQAKRPTKTDLKSIENDEVKVVKITTTCLPTYGVILMGLTIGLLLVTVICLLIFIYKIKQKGYCKSISDNFEITKNDFTTKYDRTISTETNVNSFPRSNCNNENRFKLERQNSKMTIVEFPTTFEENETKRREPNTNTRTLSKVLNQPVEVMRREYMEQLCKGVLAKKQRISESTSLSNLENIAKENNKPYQEKETLLTADKSSSSPYLDTDNSLKVSPSTSVKKLEELSDSISKHSNDISSKKVYPPFRLPKIKGKRAIDDSYKDDIYDNPPNNNRLISADEGDVDQVNDIYDNPPIINRPLLDSTKGEEHADDVYDNPPNSNRSVFRTINNDDYLDDLYVDIPNNRPVGNVKNDDEPLDDLYDNLQCNKPVFEKASTAMTKQKINKCVKAGNDDQYDLPHKQGRGILVSDDNNTGYVGAYTNDNEPCFNAFYGNAKTLKSLKH